MKDQNLGVHDKKMIQGASPAEGQPKSRTHMYRSSHELTVCELFKDRTKVRSKNEWLIFTPHKLYLSEGVGE